jgi:hypothetical protein
MFIQHSLLDAPPIRARIPNPLRARLHLILLPSVLALALPGWAEARPADARSVQARPLNLSLPREVLQAPGSQQIDETVKRNLHAPTPIQGSTPSAHPAALPYGAGYEHRRHEMGGAGAGAGAGAAGGGGGGAGRRGR